MRAVLLVEDDFLNRRLTKKVLIENGYTVFEAKNAIEAKKCLLDNPIDLAILDINLGEEEQDGISLGADIKDMYSIPIVYLTAYENPEIINRAVATSPYSYLTKPFKNTDLIVSVEIALKQNLRENRKSFISVKDGEFTVPLAVEEINYIECEGNYLMFYTDDKVFKLRSTIKQITEELPKSMFIQVHRAYVVNKSKIEKYSLKTVIVKGCTLPISKKIN